MISSQQKISPSYRCCYRQVTQSIKCLHCVYISELVYIINELLSSSQAVSHPSQNIGKVRKTASFYLFHLKYFYVCSLCLQTFSRVGFNTNIQRKGFLPVSTLCCHFQILFPTILSFMKPSKHRFLSLRRN